MKDGKEAPGGGYSVEEILAEAQLLEQRGKSGGKPAPARKSSPAAGGMRASLGAEEVLRRARRALNMEAGKEPAPPGGDAPEPPKEPEKKPKKKKRFSLFRRKRKEEDAGGMEDDIYYGLQLKPLEEYRRQYEETVRGDEGGPAAPAAPAEAEKPAGDSGAERPGAPQPSFPYLFDRRPAAEEKPDPALAEAVEKLHRERQERLEKIMEHAGVDAEDIFGPESPSPEIPPPRETPVRPEMPPVSPPGPMRPAGPPRVPAPDSPPRPGTRPPKPPGPMHPAPPAVTPPRVPELTNPEEERADAQEAAAPEDAASENGSPEGSGAGVSAAVAAAPEPPPAPVREPGAPPPAKNRRPLPPKREEPKDRPAPEYRADRPPLHVIDPGGFEDALAAEAAKYEPPAPAAPEPIPFPLREPPAQKAGEAPAPRPEAEKPPEAEANAPESGEPEAEAPPPPRNVEPLPLPPEEPPRPKKRFRLFGSEEDAAGPGDEPSGPEEALEDYAGPEDAPSVQNDLAARVRGLLLRFAVTGLCMVLLLAFGLVSEHPALLPPGLHSLYDPQASRIVQLIFLLISAAFCGPAVWNGLSGLFTFQANADSAAAVAAAAALLQDAVFLASGQPAGLHLYVPLAAAALFLNTAGKLSMARRMLRNFRFVSSPERKCAVRLLDDPNTALRLVPKGADPDPKIACQAGAGFLSDFLRLSYAPDPADRMSQLLAPIGFIAGLVLCIVSAVLTKDGLAALTVFTASACVCVPFANTLCAALPLARLSKIAARCGGMAVGWPAVERFSETGWVVLDAQELFPRGTVTLNGIQTFAGSRIDRAILDATALAEAAGGPLSDLFSQIVKSRSDILPRAERTAYEDGAGVSGTVSGRTVLVGNRELLKKHGVEAPSRDYEEKYLRAGKLPLYLACGGSLVAMFLVSYRSDRRRARELRRLEYNGIGVIVRGRDPNITPRLLAECFGVSEHSVSVLPERLGEVFRGLREHPPERPRALLATKGRATAMMRLLAACVRQRGNIAVAAALLAAGPALGFALVAFLTFYSGLGQLSATALALFEAFWTLAVLLVPRIRRP